MCWHNHSHSRLTLSHTHMLDVLTLSHTLTFNTITCRLTFKTITYTHTKSCVFSFGDSSQPKGPSMPAHDPEPNVSVTLLLRACALRRRRAHAQHGTTWATSSYPPRQIGPTWPFQLQCCIHHACSDNGSWTRLHAHRAAQLRRRSADRIRLALASRSTAGTLRLTRLSTILIDAMEKPN